MNCDLVVMAENASLYMAFPAISLVPNGGNSWLLLKGMGYHRALAERIAAAPLATASTKKILRNISNVSFSDAFTAEAQALAPLTQSAVFQQGVH